MPNMLRPQKAQKAQEKILKVPKGERINLREEPMKARNESKFSQQIRQLIKR